MKSLSKSGPGVNSLICSMRFKPDDFVRRLDLLEEEGILLTPWLEQHEVDSSWQPLLDLI